MMKLKMKKDSYPSKRTLNLVFHEKTMNSPTRVLPLFFLYLVLLGAFVKLAVLGPMEKANEAQAALRQAQGELARFQSYNADYDEVVERYNKYSNEYLNEDEKLIVDRTAVLALIESVVMNQAAVPSISISGQTCSLVITSVPLNVVSAIVEEMQRSPLVYFIAVSTAGTNQSKMTADGQAAVNPQQLVTANLTITLSGGDAQ